MSIYLSIPFHIYSINHHSYVPFFLDDEVDDLKSIVLSVSGKSLHHLCSNCLESLVKELYARCSSWISVIRIWACVSLICKYKCIYGLFMDLCLYIYMYIHTYALMFRCLYSPNTTLMIMD